MVDVSLYISMGDLEKALDTVDSAIVNLEGISGIPMKLSDIESIRVFPDVVSTFPLFGSFVRIRWSGCSSRFSV